VDWQLRCGVAAQYEAPNGGHAARLLFGDLHQCQLCIYMFSMQRYSAVADLTA
jgi:hypothetical protein